MDQESSIVQIEQKEKIIEIKQNGITEKVIFSENTLFSNDEEMLNQSGSETQSVNEELSTNEREHFLEQKWKKPQTQSNFALVHEMLEKGLGPSEILQSLLGSDCKVPSDLSESVALRLLIEFINERRFRTRLPQYHDFTHAVELFQKSKKILMITGAGVSTSCGIPDFRSTKGIYATLKQTFPDLPSPTAMFDIDYFKRNPQPFYSFAKEIFPGLYKPSVSHMFIKFLENEGKLLRNYTQNIDTLERLAGITKYIECHGSFGAATCLQCDKKYTSDDIRDSIYAQKVAICHECGDGLIKPDIVFFGENLPDHFHNQMALDRDEVDLVVVVGSSLQVQPVSLIPYNVDENTPQILINKEDLPSYGADIKLIGDCDSIIVALCLAIGGKFKEMMLEELKSRNSPRLDELESLLSSNPDSIMPAAINEEIIKKQIEEDEAREDEERKKDEEDEVPAKQLKLDEEATNAEALSKMYESKYVSVSSRLKPHSYAKFMPNLNIFQNADFYYNTEQQTFGALPRVKIADDDFDDDPNSDSSSSASSSQHECESNPELRRKEFAEFSVKERDTNSCPPFSDSSCPNSPSSN